MEFEFRPNPYFTDLVVTKDYVFEVVGGGSNFNRLLLRSGEVRSPIQWAEGRDLTVRSVAGKTRPTASFFALFKKGGWGLVYPRPEPNPKPFGWGHAYPRPEPSLKQSNPLGGGMHTHALNQAPDPLGGGMHAQLPTL